MWCKTNSKNKYCRRLTKELIGWETTSKVPQDPGIKGSFSTTLLHFIEGEFGNQVQAFHDEPTPAFGVRVRGFLEQCHARDVFRRAVSKATASSKNCRLRAALLEALWEVGRARTSRWSEFIPSSAKGARLAPFDAGT